jgi:5-(aminomethyl)-3-furanmethanol phosphate kinase
VRITVQGNWDLSVIKIGGGLTQAPGALRRVCAAVSELSHRHALLIVPGGGPFADAVRAFDRKTALSADAAHWMAILAMDQYAQVLAERIEGAELVEEPGSVGPTLARGGVAVLAPYRWMRSADVLPHRWDVTSDSVAAFVAGALGAARLVLIKPADGSHQTDPFFEQALPAGLPCLSLSWERLGELPGWFSGQTAAGAPRE